MTKGQQTELRPQESSLTDLAARRPLKTSLLPLMSARILKAIAHIISLETVIWVEVKLQIAFG